MDSGILSGRYDRIWVNPDCGLKTRGWPETIAALRNMVEAAAQVRPQCCGSENNDTGKGLCQANYRYRVGGFESLYHRAN